MLTLPQVWQADLDELNSIIRNTPHAEHNTTAYQYAEILYYYLINDIASLEKKINAINSSPTTHEKKIIIELGLLRLDIRKASVNADRINETLEAVDFFPDWLGETYFVVAMAFEDIQKLDAAFNYYKKAEDEFAKYKCEKKSIKSRLNMAVINSKQFSKKSHIHEYYQIYRKARASNAHDVAGICLLNISREYEEANAMGLAEQYAKRSLTILQNFSGHRSYFLAAAHYCNLLIKLERLWEAKELYEDCELSGLPEIEAALNVLSTHMNKSLNIGYKKNRGAHHATEQWKERLQEIESNDKNNKQRLTDLEEKLVSYLSTKPRTKAEIIAFLYGEKILYSAAENRFYNLLNRLKKKIAQKIKNKNGIYFIGERKIKKVG